MSRCLPCEPRISGKNRKRRIAKIGRKRQTPNRKIRAQTTNLERPKNLLHAALEFRDDLLRASLFHYSGLALEIRKRTLARDDALLGDESALFARALAGSSVEIEIFFAAISTFQHLVQVV